MTKEPMRGWSESVCCHRDGDCLEVVWDGSDGIETEVYYTTRPEIDGTERFLCRGTDGSACLCIQLGGERVYFILRREGYAPVMVAERLVVLEGACNFRDLGGYRSSDGRRVKWGRLYWAGSLSGLTPADVRHIGALRLKTVLDYRSPGEAERHPDRPIPGVRYLAVPAVSGDYAIDMSAENLMRKLPELQKMGDPAVLVGQGYARLVFGNAAYREMFALMRAGVGVPFVQHCTSGKDRTGLGAALLLLMLGVPEETVRADYMASNRYIAGCATRMPDKSTSVSDPTLRAALHDLMTRVHERYLDTAIGAIRGKYDSFETFFAAEYGLTAADQAALRDRYLE